MARPVAILLLLAACILSATAWLRAPEYDEAYSIFLTAGDPRPAWPPGVFSPAETSDKFSGDPGFAEIARDLRRGDVHPPLYFWCLKIWRAVCGPGWFTARLLSVLFSLAALALTAGLAALAGIPPLAATSLLLLSYGFAYTGIVARGFAAAQALNLLGFFWLLRAPRSGAPRWHAFGAGLALGAASFCNYLAVFNALAAFTWAALARERRRLLPPGLIGFLPFLPADFWFFVAQRNSRLGQFVPFSPPHAILLLLRDAAASLLGGLPLYAGRFSPLIAAGLALLLLACLAFAWRNQRKIPRLFLLTALAPPLGLLALGLVFGNTPIEIRYLAFALPFCALILAATLPRPLRALLLTVQAAAIFGLATAPQTMQPQARAARAIAAWHLPDALVLLPSGNDGVGIPGPFLAAAPDGMHVLLLRTGPPMTLPPARDVILVLSRVDDSSRAQTAQAQNYFRAHPCFARVRETVLAVHYVDRCGRKIAPF